MDRTDIILLLMSDKDIPIVGTTRLQKLTFLIEHETKVKLDEENFEFIPYIFGPSSNKLYDDINFLVNLGYIEKTGEEKIEGVASLDDIENLNADSYLIESKEIIAEQEDEDINASTEEESLTDDLTVYRITAKGYTYLLKKKLLETNESKEIKKIVKNYGKKSLLKLLQYVYNKYPEYTTESIILNKIK